MGLAPQNPSPPLRGAPGAPLRGGGARRARPRYTHVKDAPVLAAPDRDVVMPLGSFSGREETRSSASPGLAVRPDSAAHATGGHVADHPMSSAVVGCSTRWPHLRRLGPAAVPSD